jgi:hypothetical protein
MRIEFAALGSTLLARGPIPSLARTTNPDNRGGDPNPEMGGRTASRLARKRGVYNAITQILAVGPSHGAPPSHP